MGVWAFILCTNTDDLKKKEQKPRNNNKQVFLEHKTKKSFVLHNLCPVHEVLTGISNPLLKSEQTFNSFGQ